MKTPFQIYKDRQKRREMIYQIKEKSKLYEMTLEKSLVIDLIKLHTDYENKFGKEYKG